MTIKVAKLVDRLAVADRTVAIPVSATRYIGPFTDDYKQTDGNVYVDPDSTDLRLSAYRVD